MDILNILIICYWLDFDTQDTEHDLFKQLPAVSLFNTLASKFFSNG